MVCTRMCVLHLGSGNETTLLTGSLLKTRGGENLVTVERKLSTFGASIFRRPSSYNVIVKWYYEDIHLSPSSFV